MDFKCYVNNSLNAFLIDTFDAFILYSPVSSYAVYPVTYLRADVKITSGTGLASDPYILSIEQVFLTNLSSLLACVFYRVYGKMWFVG